MLLAWVRGVLKRMRERGAIEHPWLRKLIEEDGNRHFIWRGRPSSEGMPAFPIGRTAPAFPRVGPASSVRESVLDQVSTPQSWYAQWAARVLQVTPAEGASLARLLLKRLAALRRDRGQQQQGQRRGLRHRAVGCGRRTSQHCGARRTEAPAGLPGLPGAGHRHRRRSSTNSTVPRALLRGAQAG